MNDNILPAKKKRPRYILEEKDYVKAKRDNKRLKKIKPLVQKLNKIINQVK